jgi:hypothetical protein
VAAVTPPGGRARIGQRRCLGGAGSEVVALGCAQRRDRIAELQRRRRTRLLMGDMMVLDLTAGNGTGAGLARFFYDVRGGIGSEVLPARIDQQQGHGPTQRHDL